LVIDPRAQARFRDYSIAAIGATTSDTSQISANALAARQPTKPFGRVRFLMPLAMMGYHTVGGHLSSRGGVFIQLAVYEAHATLPRS